MKKVKNISMVILVLLVPVLVLASEADEIDGLRTQYYSENYSNLSSLKVIAREGNAEAQFLVAEAYFWGNGFAQNFERSNYWYQLSADSGWLEAQYAVGIYYLSGSYGFEQSLLRAVDYFEKAATGGNVQSACSLAYLQLNGSWAATYDWSDHVSRNNYVCQR